MSEMDLNGFKLHLFRKGCKQSTIKRRVWNIKHVLANCDLTPSGIDAYFLSLLQSGKKAKYVNSLVDSVRVYADFTHRPELQHLKDFKEDPTVRSCMSDEEIEAFLTLPCPERHCVSKFGKPFTRKIDQENYYSQTVFFTICAYTGMRMGEVAKLTIDDMLWGDDCIRVVNDKTGKNRVIPIAPNIHEQLESYCRGLRGPKLFPAQSADRVINSVTWGDAFHKRLERLGIKRQGLTPYSLRHSFIRSMLNEDVDLFKVQRIVGHSRIETTAIYRNLVYKDLVSAIKKLPLVTKNADPHIYLEHVKETVRAFNFENDARFDFELRESREELHLHVRLKK